MEKILSIPSDPEDTSKPKTAARAAVFSFTTYKENKDGDE